MNKKKVRCYKTFEKVNDRTYNYPIFNMVYDGWSNYSIATCINCGELFVIDWENPKFNNLNLNEIVAIKCCPKCHSHLKDTIKEYPKFIKLTNGQIGSFISSNYIPNDVETIIVEMFEIEGS